jgi:MarR family 2-MHQ and catechol resistance regulon transcriptional repressor
MARDTLDAQAAELDSLLTELIKRYQFRNRNKICCEDITVSQCYVLKALGEHGALPMTRLAEIMCLGISSLTRVVDELEGKHYATRRRLPADRRVCFVEMTVQGNAVLRRAEGMIRRSEREALEHMAAQEREGLLSGLRKLNAAIDACGTWKGEANG